MGSEMCIRDRMRVTGDVLSSGAKIAAHAAPLLLGLGKEKKANEWNSLVAKVRKEHGLSLKYAMVHIKNNNLYQKKTKTKTGGAPRFPLSDASVDANLRPAIVPSTRMTGNVKSLKFNEGTETVIKPRRERKPKVSFGDETIIKPKRGRKTKIADLIE